jgi:hypothetical protein
MRLARRHTAAARLTKTLAALTVPAAMVTVAGVSQGAVAGAQSAAQKPSVPSISAKPGAPNSGPDAGATSVTFTALLNPHGSVTSYCFDYGLTAKYDKVRDGSDPAWMDGETSPQFTPATTVAIEVTGYIFGLHPGTVYHYQIEAFSPYGETYSKDKTFKTLK